MKVLKLCFLLALIPTFLQAADLSGDHLYGLWYDDYTDTKLEIKHARKGIKVKHHGGWFNRWHTYYYMGRGLYDDCDGRVIIVNGYDRIEWRKGYRKVVVLSRYDDYRSYDRYSRDYGNSRNRSYGRNYNSSYSRDQYCGDWYCEDQGFSLTIEAYGNGLRARFGNDVTYYEPYRDHYRDRKGNRYYFEDKYLTWRSSDQRRRLKFRKG